MKGQKGITLIALIITIIVLLILAMVSISLVMRWNIINHANNAIQQYNEDALKEGNFLNDAENYLNTHFDKQ